MNIELKDIFENNAARATFCESVAEKLVEKGLFEEFEVTNDWGEVTGLDTDLKEAIKNSVRKVAREVVVEEIQKVLKSDYEIKSAIREETRKFIVEQFENMVKH